MPDRLVLCSASPRRKELLESAGYRFLVDPADVEERVVLDPRLPPWPRAHRAAQRIAEEKVASVAARRRDAAQRDRAREVYLAADTIVFLDDEVLGKPSGDAEAKAMLARLSGRRHQVVTAFALRRSDDERHETTSVLTEVSFKKTTKAEIDAYVASGEPRDKAGAYAIQGLGGFLVESIRGSYSNVVGLPLVEVMRALAELSDLRARPGRRS